MLKRNFADPDNFSLGLGLISALGPLGLPVSLVLSRSTPPIIGGRGLPRNIPCPCGSGEKHKHCCCRLGNGMTGMRLRERVLLEAFSEFGD